MEHRSGRRRGIAAIVLLVLGAVLLVGVTVAKAVAPPVRYTESKHVGFTMAPTYKNGETIYLEPVGKGKLKRGDIVLAKVPWSPEKYQMNRVVAVGGDQIQYKMGKRTAQNLLLNGKPYDEAYLEEWKYPSTVVFDVTVPKGQLFLMADNRLNSDGSQFANNGPVPAGNVAWKVVALPMAMLALWAQLAGAVILVMGGALAYVARKARKRGDERVAAKAAAKAAKAAAAKAAADAAAAQEAGAPVETGTEAAQGAPAAPEASEAPQAPAAQS
ncbi:signal peptidase I [Streptomyces sp. NPDC051183]|uniref:signal peptidase I n=1 Tax=unclassified Streptomyces TaxID=2593676 RepID=UPI003422C102